MSNIGIMDPAFFVGKNILLNWINEFFQANYTKVEQMCSGAMACQIMDAIYPGKVALHKVNFDAKTESEYVNNFKVLQAVFDSEAIIKYIDVPKLIKGKYMDNLEFFQWLKQYFDKNYSGNEYNAVERREQAKLAYKKQRGGAGAQSAVITPAPSKPKAAPAPAAAAAPKPVVKAVAPAKAAPVAAVKRPSSGGKSAVASAGIIESLQQQLAELTESQDTLEHERKFYFSKLRELEILCQSSTDVSDGNQFKQQVLDILYRGDEDFTSPDPTESKQTEAGLLGTAESGLLDNSELDEAY